MYMLKNIATFKTFYTGFVQLLCWQFLAVWALQITAQRRAALGSRGTGVPGRPNRVEIICVVIRVEKVTAILDKRTRKCVSQETKGQHSV